MILNDILALLEELNDGRLIQHYDNPNGADQLTCQVCYANLYRTGHRDDCLLPKIPQMISELKEMIDQKPANDTAKRLVDILSPCD